MRAMILMLAFAACTTDPHDEVTCGDWGRQFNDSAKCDAACESRDDVNARLDGRKCMTTILGVPAEVATIEYGGERGYCSGSDDGYQFVECE
jgi:hypothetical protein